MNSILHTEEGDKKERRVVKTGRTNRWAERERDVCVLGRGDGGMAGRASLFLLLSLFLACMTTARFT